MTAAARSRDALAARFWARVHEQESSGCWEWTGARDKPDGYGRVRLEGRQHLAHRVAYQLAHGSIPDGMTIDHLCRNKPCVNPDHLEAVTERENYFRWVASVTECPQGHPYTPENTRFSKGHRNCNECGRQWTRRKRAQKPQFICDICGEVGDASNKSRHMRRWHRAALAAVAEGGTR